MATLTQISLAEYLDTIYHPDCDYIEGQVRERNVGKWEHSRVQWLLANWFGKHETLWNIVVSTEQRMRVAPNRVRIADLIVLRPGPQPDILTHPPLLVIEILAPGDTYSDLQERCQDYRIMGVQTVWIIDPKTRTGRMCIASDWLEATRLEIPGTPIYVELPTLFTQLDASANPAS